MRQFRSGSALTLLFGTWCSLAVFADSAMADRYVVVRMDSQTRPQSSAVADMNESGRTCGFILVSGDHTAVTWVNGIMTSVEPYYAEDSYASGLNDVGNVVGSIEIRAEQMEFHAFRLHARTGLVDLHELFGGTYSLAGDINDIGQMLITTGQPWKYFFDGLTPHRVDPLPGYPRIDELRLNQRGQLVGESRGETGEARGTLWENGVSVDIGTLGGSNTWPRAMNDRGHVVGYANTAGDAAVHAFYYDGQQMRDLGTLGAPYNVRSEAYDINHDGDVIGQCLNSSGLRRAFLWQNGVMYDLQSLLDPTGAWQLVYASHLNDAGWIQCYAIQNGEGHHVILKRNEDLSISPTDLFTTIGRRGDTLWPDCKTYTLTNEGATPLGWQASSDAPWLSCAPQGGNLAPGNSVEVRACLTGEAAALQEGVHPAIIAFVHGGGAIRQTRGVRVRIGCNVDMVDCDSNGTPDGCDIAWGEESDCNQNLVMDACELASGTASDCDVDGWIDTCALGYVEQTSPRLWLSGAPANGVGVSHLFADAPLSLTDVTVRIEASGDLSGATRYLDVFLDDALGGRVFASSGGTCANPPDSEVFSISASVYNAIAADGRIVARVVPAPAVDKQACGTASYVVVKLSHRAGLGSILDCDNNHVPDACQLEQEDCNSNAIPDACDLVGATSADCDDDRFPDECQPDCNSNAIADICDTASETSDDCDTDQVPDECQDCNANGRGDVCDVRRVFQSESPTFTPFGHGTDAVHTISNPPLALSPVVFEFEMVGDMTASDHRVSIYLNDQFMRYAFFGADGDCPAAPFTDEWILNASVYNWITRTGEARIRLVPFLMETNRCVPPSYCRFTLRYATLAEMPDCNSNQRPDACDLQEGASQDCDSNGVPDECDSTVTYRLDDATAEDDPRWNGDGDIIWLNQFTVQPGGETINAVGLAWSRYLSAGRPMCVLVYADPNGDGDPGDGRLLTTTETTVQRPGSGVLTEVPIAPTFVGGAGASFFVGGVITTTDWSGAGRLDDDSLSRERSWMAGAAAGQANIHNLSNNPDPPRRVSQLEFPGNWLLAAFSCTVDCNRNGLADSCEEEDCNSNNVSDVIDVAGGTSADCDDNGLPDDCDLLTDDCDGNGRVDSCELFETDCNLNGFPDACDIAAGTSLDCDSNRLPDQCDVAEGLHVDCNSNGAPDECDLRAGTSADCDSRGVPDECETADCNTNGTSDTLETCAGSAPDCNGNFIPDRCDLVRPAFTGFMPKLGLEDGVNLRPARAADFDGDEDLDAIGLMSNVVNVFFNDGAAQLGPAVRPSSGVRTFTIGDVDRDGDVDVVCGNTVNDLYWVLANRGDGTFETQPFFACGFPPADLILADLNLDGHLDLAATSNTTSRFAVAFNRGDGTFMPSRGYSPGLDVVRILAANLDGDYAPELVLLGRTVGNAFIFHNNGHGVFDGTTVLSIGQAPSDLAAFDVEQDGDLDLVIGHRTDQRVFVFRNRGDASFDSPDTFGNYSEPGSIAPGDFDGDGDIDFLIGVSGGSGSMRLFRNNGAGVFSGSLSFSVGPDFVAGLVAGDFDGNGEIDVFVANGHTGVHRNGMRPFSRDCNHNVVPDECDAAAGDCDDNGVPDACELIRRDCNANGSHDACDIASGGSTDCDSNGVPDDCQSSDHDCNSNGVFDACEIHDGRSVDCDHNGIPDACELDCNRNGVGDACDIADGTSQDCDSNRTPDECDPDCNANGLADGCDILQGRSNDCNTNRVADDCEDCNSNRLADVCDVAGGASTDVDVDGIPDDCEFEVSIMPVPVLLDPATTSGVRLSLPESVSAVVRGQRFFVELWASDVGSARTGLTSVYVDVTTCGQTTALSLFHADSFATFPSGVIQGARVEEFGGSALPSGGGVEPEWVRVGWIEMRAATEASTCRIALAPSATGVAVLDEGLVPPPFVEHGSAMLEITPPSRTYDLDGDGFIGLSDVGIFIASWLQSVPPAPAAHDFDCDGFIGPGDLSWFATAWLKSANDATILFAPCPSGSGRDAGGRGGPGSSSPDVSLRLIARNAPSITDMTTMPPESVRSVPPGHSYFIELWATDLGDINTGLTCVYVDLTYPSGLSAVNAISHGGIYTLLATGQALNGVVTNLGGSALPHGGAVEPTWIRLAILGVEARQPSPTVTYALSASQAGISAYGRGLIDWSRVDHPSLTLSHGVAGDIDGDGDQDRDDLTAFIAVLSGASHSPGQFAASDLNGDGHSDGRDIGGFVGSIVSP